MGTEIVDRKCPECGEGPITTTMTPDPYRFRCGEGTVMLNCILPVRKCGSCQFEYLDHESEKIRTQTTNAYLRSIGEPTYCEECGHIKCRCEGKPS